MYTELVEGENGKVEPAGGDRAAVVGVKKLLIDVSSWDISLVDLVSELTCCMTDTLFTFYCS